MVNHCVFSVCVFSWILQNGFSFSVVFLYLDELSVL